MYNDCCDFDNELISYKGICSEEVLENMLDIGDTTWTQFFIPEILDIPTQKPDVEQIISITSSINIISQRVIKTPVLKDNQGVPVVITNNEGTKITGRKLVIEGILQQKVMYTADVDEQSVHSAHFNVPFSVFIILPPDTLLSEKYTILTCIEDVFACLVNKRQIFKNTTIFIKAKPYYCG